MIGDVTVIEPRFVPGLPDPAAALTGALRQPDRRRRPCASVVRPDHRVGIIFSDITRATPHGLILPAVLARAERTCPRENITLFNALGTHRPNTDAELRGMLGGPGRRVPRSCRTTPSTRRRRCTLGVTSRGHEIWLNREVAACDVKILTGFIEPHFFAGFSGGGKALMPGMAGQRTVLGNHDAGMIADPNATWGVTHGNPIWEEVMEVAHMVRRHLPGQRDAQPRQGDHRGLCRRSGRGARGGLRVRQADGDGRRSPRPFDIVITTNSGYPLDLNLYQAVKGMSAAAQVVKPGRRDHRGRRLLGRHPRSRPVRPAAARGEQPAAAAGYDHRARLPEAGSVAGADPGADPAQGRCVRSHSTNLTDAQIRDALLKPCRDIRATVEMLRERYGPDATICVLPEGPQTIPYVVESERTGA